MDMKSFWTSKIEDLVSTTKRAIDRLSPVADIAGRVYISRVFLLSGWNKLSDWNSTLYLFTSEYDVPLLPPVLAAVLATSAELVLSMLLLLGVETQLAACGLFLVNIVAVISYYDELSSTPAAIHDHIEWGLILALLMTQTSHPINIGRGLKHTLSRIGITRSDN